jgi:hypothetical protein
MDYDPAGGQLLLFGGLGNGALADTWGWTSGPPTPVSISMSSGPAPETNSTSATLAFTASGGVGALTYTCELDTPHGTGSPGPCASSTGMTYNNLTTNGAYRFTVTVADALGDAGSATSSWTVDTAPPVISILSQLQASYPLLPSGGDPFYFSCGDAYDTVTTCAASLSGTGISGATALHNGDPIPISTAGTFTVTVNAQDQAGNTAQPQQVSYSVANPAPRLDDTSATSALKPNQAAAGSAGITLKVFGVPFVYNVSQVDWNGSPLSGASYYFNGSPVTTTGASGDEIDVHVPAADLARVGVNQVTVVTPGPGGGTTSPVPFYVVPAGVTVSGFTLSTSSFSSGQVLALTDTLNAVGSGQGTLATARYSGGPETTTPPTPVNAYFDIWVAPGSSLTSLKVQDCKLDGGSRIYYWTGSAWAPVAGQSYDADSDCVTFTLTNTSTPSIGQLSGTPFGVQNVPPVVADPGAQSGQYGQPLSFNVSATDVEPYDTVTIAASGLPAGLSLGQTNFSLTGNQARWTATVSGTAPAGTYTASFTANDGTGTSTPLSVPVTVTRAPLTITANNQSMPYGGSVPAFGAGYSGFVGDDTSSVVSGLSCGATDGSGQPVSSSTPAGTYAITCGGAGAANYSISYQPGTLTITQDATSVTLAPVALATQGQPVTFTAVVAVTGPGAGTPTGAVTFMDGATTLGTGQLSVAGGTDQATFSTSSLGVGAHTITASYGGDGNFTPSSSAAAIQDVNTNLGSYPTLPSGAYNLSNANLAGGYFLNAALSQANLQGAILSNANFSGANLSGADLSNSNPKARLPLSANFTRASLTNANLSNSNFRGATFTGADLSGADLTNSSLLGTTGLQTATLTNVIWSNTVCPDGSNSDQDGGTCVGHF